MGCILTCIQQRRLKARQPRRLLVVGQNGSGKSTLLWTLDQNIGVHPQQTIGFNFFQFKLKRQTLTIHDLGGHKKIRGLARHHGHHACGIVFVVDATDRVRIMDEKNDNDESVLETFNNILKIEHLKGKPVLILANKQDLPNALSKEEIYDALKCDEIHNRMIVCKESNYHNLKGLKIIFNDWLNLMEDELVKKKR